MAARMQCHMSMQSKCCCIGHKLELSVCAGVPVKRMVAGVAMGLILEEGGRFQVLTDILGSEDALGDMDFKVAGDAEGVTAFQMDIKVSHPSVMHQSSISHCLHCKSMRNLQSCATMHSRYPYTSPLPGPALM